MADMVADMDVDTILTRIHNFASQICIQCKWRQLVARFATNANGATIWWESWSRWLKLFRPEAFHPACASSKLCEFIIIIYCHAFLGSRDSNCIVLLIRCEWGCVWAGGNSAQWYPGTGPQASRGRQDTRQWIASTVFVWITSSNVTLLWWLAPHIP